MAPSPLAGGETHVWRVALDPPRECVARCLARLSDAERARAERFRFPKHRDHFAVARSALRGILARYLSVSPEVIEFSYAEHGKPELSDAGAGVQFNVSHSGELALCAVCLGHSIGVDIEWAGRRLLRNEAEMLRLAKRFFAPDELAALRALPPADRAQGFLNCWTRKEAYIKARGEGLSLPLDEFTVSLAPDQTPALLHTSAGPEEANRWSLHALDPGDGYVAAVAVEGGSATLQLWQWTGQH